MEDKELIQKFQLFEKQIMQTQEQLQAIEQGLLELNELSEGLDALVGKTDEEILAPIGRGVFVKATLLSEELTVDVGERTFVTKSIEETKKIIEDQIEKLNAVREELDIQLQEINQELTKTMLEHQKKKQSKECACDPGHACECGEDHDCDCSDSDCEDGCDCH